MKRDEKGKKKMHENGASCERGEEGILERSFSTISSGQHVSRGKLIGELFDDVVVGNNSRES